MKTESLPTRSPTRKLVDFLQRLSPDTVPVSVIGAAKACLLDTLGCALFGFGETWAMIMADEMISEGARGRSTIVGHPESLAAPAAALCNGTAAHGFELDDHLDEAIVHPGAIVVSAALAAAESADASGFRLLLGLIAGYEILDRVGRAMGVEPSVRGWHKTALAGPLGAAASAGVVMGLDADRLHTAICLACATASGTKAFATGAGGGMEKRMHAGRAAEAGVRMAQLAARGFTAPPTGVDGRFGLLQVVSSHPQSQLLASNLGARWAIEHVYVKVYPCCAWIQAVVQQLVVLRGPRPLSLREIAKVTVGVSVYAGRQNSNVAPPDTMGAQFSIPYCAALALMANPGDPALYAGAAIDDVERRELARRIEIVVDPEMEAAYPRHYGARVELELANGERRGSSVLDPHGMPTDPCTEGELLEKFHTLASRVMARETADDIVTRIKGAERLGSARELGTLLRHAEGRA